MNEWKTVIEQPGYFGKRRDAMYAGYDETYGNNNWRVAWEIPLGTPLYVEMPGVLALYEDGYHAHFQANPDLLQQLVEAAADVYDDAPSNVASGLDYTLQETKLNHLHDISIRRAVLRLGTWFRGSEIIQLRHVKSGHPLSMLLSPGQIPFHKPELIRQPELTEYWWDAGSIESFYQSNKVIQQRVMG